MMTLGKSLKIFEILPEILRDLSFSCQDLGGSFIFLPGFSRIFHFLAGIFHFLAMISHFPVKILKDLGKEMEDR